MSTGPSDTRSGDVGAAAPDPACVREWRREGFLVTTDPARFDLDVIHGYLRRSYWAEGIPRETVERSLRNSLGFALLAQGPDGGAPRQIGFARVVSDRATFAWLADVFVLEEWRGRGVCAASRSAPATPTVSTPASVSRHSAIRRARWRS